MGLTPSSSRWNHNSTLLCRLLFHSGRWGELTFLYCKHGCRNPTWRLGGVSASISRVSTRNTAHEGWRRAHARFRDRTEWTASWVDSVVSLVRLPRACTTTTGRARFGGYRPRDRGTCQDGCGLGPIAIREFLRQIVFTDASVRAVLTDPEEGNLRSLRAFRKAGFKVTKTVQLAGEDFKRSVVRMDRT